MVVIMPRFLPVPRRQPTPCLNRRVSFQILFHRQRVDFRKRSRRLTHIKLARDHISDKAKSVVHHFE